MPSQPVRRVRQHHALEHATITLLMRRNAHLQFVGGRSDHRGFYIFGPVDSDALQEAAQEALARLQRGEAGLAIHPNCGTNLVTSGTLAGVAGLLATTVGRRRQASLWDQLPFAILAATLALLLGRPLGFRLQRHVTTLADVRNLRLGQVSRRQFGRWVQHFVRVEELR
jgi:hypothetical protein